MLTAREAELWSVVGSETNKDFKPFLRIIILASNVSLFDFSILLYIVNHVML